MVEPARETKTDGDLPPPRSRAVVQAGLASLRRLAHESRRNTLEEETRPAPRRVLSLRAVWSTWRVIWSYLWLRFRARFHSYAWSEQRLRATHLRNARRIERTIIELQGLFIM